MNRPTLEQLESAVNECLGALNRLLPVLFAELYLARETLAQEADAVFGLNNEPNTSKDPVGNGGHVHAREDAHPDTGGVPMDLDGESEAVVQGTQHDDGASGEAGTGEVPKPRATSKGSAKDSEQVDARSLLKEVGRKIRSESATQERDA